MYCIIIVSFKNSADTLKCLESIFVNRGDFVVVVVDNGPENFAEALADWISSGADGVRDHIAMAGPSEFDPVALNGRNLFVLKSENRGFAAANNFGIVFAREHFDVSFYWLLNNDTVVAPGAGEALYKYALARPDVGITGALLVYFDSGDLVQGTGFHFDPVTTRGYYIDHLRAAASAFDLSDIEQKITYVIGASMFVSAEFIRDVGLMDETYFLYFEEYDWALRAGNSYRQSICLDAIVYHKEGASIGSSTRGRPSPMSSYYLARSMILFYRKHFVHLLPVAVLRQFFNFGRYTLTGDSGNAVAVLKGLGSGLQSLTQLRR